MVNAVTMEVDRRVVLGGGDRDGCGGDGGGERGGGQHINKLVTFPPTTKEIETIMKRKGNMEERPPLPKTQQST